MLSTICDLVTQLRLSVLGSGLDVLKLAEAGISSRLELAGVRATLTAKKAEVRANPGAINHREGPLSEASSGVEEL